MTGLLRYLPKGDKRPICDLAGWEVDALERVADSRLRLQPFKAGAKPSDDESWYILVINPNCHRRAEGGLADLGYRTFWPKYRKWASHARVKVAKEYPILGRYLFAEVHDDNFYAVRNVNGVEAIITGDDRAPAKVSETVVWDYWDRYMRGEWDFIAKEAIPIGARVRIMEGEFADMLAVIRKRNRGKLQFLASGKFYTTNEANVRAA